MPRSVLLLPGVGEQGGTPADVARAFTSGPASALVSASRSVIYATATAPRLAGRGRRGGGTAARRGVGRFGLVNRRAAARIAAPVAFLVGVTLAVVLVRAGLSDEPGRPRGAGHDDDAADDCRNDAATTTQAQPVLATVESGDTLDQIALDHDTTVERLLELNPNLDPRELQVGQQVRVRGLSNRAAHAATGAARSSSRLRRRQLHPM